MRRLFILSLLALIVAAPAYSWGRHGGGVSISIDDGDVTDCGDLRIRFGGERAHVLTEEVSVAGVRSLRVRSARQGGIRVTGWSGSSYSVQACKAVADGVNPADIRVTFSGSELSATGPDGGDWVVYFLVRAPRGATLDLDSTNGPVSLDSVDGTVTARVTNGPLSLRNTSGRVDASSTNGPISIAGGGGEVKAQATNGPLSVKLEGSGWNGTLDASTKNGPVSLKLPRGYRSGVVLESRGRGPITCRADDCRLNSLFDGEDDEPRRIQLGSGPQNIHLSTVNGPVSVKNAE
ncbi:MAG TPA: hypothetical protein VMS98_19950 [Thermoanaerobaculia bacterium]|nr:hypothetical protein [Thermoanaerobaculia bacterium]